MERQRLILILLFLSVTASGCISGGGNQESARSITVHQLSVQPNQIYEDTSVRASVDLANTGSVPAEVDLGENGERVMKDYCPDIFEISGGVSVTTSGEREGNIVRLEPGDELRLRWNLAQEGDVPLYGQRCDLKFQVPFNYSVNAYKQVQIKKNREVENTRLRTESSSGPLMLAMETLGSSSDNPSVFISGEDDTITLLTQLRNTGHEDYNKGVVDVREESLAIRATDPLQLHEGFGRFDDLSATRTDYEGRETTRFIDNAPAPGGGGTTEESGDQESSGNGPTWDSYGYSNENCDVSDNSIRMFEGDSRVLKCDLPVPSKDELGSPSTVSEIFAKVEYTYLRDIGTRRVEVQTRG